jgi:hypothetical protein
VDQSQPLFAEDLLLLLTDDESGKRAVDTTRLDLALAGAVVLELVELGRLDLSGPGEEARAGRLVVRDDSPTGRPVLDTALERLGRSRPQKPQQALQRLTKGLRSSVYSSLEARGVLRHRRGRVLWVFPSDQWPAVASGREQQVRRALHDVLTVGRSPDRREVLLVSLLHAIDQLPKVLGVSGAEKRMVRSRAKELAEGELAGDAVTGAVRAVRAAVTAAAAAATAGAGG